MILIYIYIYIDQHHISEIDGDREKVIGRHEKLGPLSSG